MNARFAAISVATLATLTALAAADWNTGVGGNSARNSLAPSSGPTAATLLWESGRPAIVAQQGAADGDLFVTSRIESFTIPTGTWITAQDANTGVERWAVQLPEDFPGTSWRSRASAVRDGRVYASRAGNTNLDYLYALSAIDGSILWRSADLVDEGSTESLAFTDDGDIVAGNFQSLIRIDHETGDTMWNVDRSCPTSSGCQVALFGDTCYVWEPSPGGPMISAFDAMTGAFLYATPAITPGFAQQIGPFVAPDGTVYAPRAGNNPATDFLVALDDTGTALVERWRRPLGYVPFASFGVGPDGSVYSYEVEQVGSDADLTVLRLDPATGDVLDDTGPLRTNFPPQPRMAIDDAGRVYLTNGGFDLGRVYAFEADLSLIWSKPVTRVNVGGPVLTNDNALIVCGTGAEVRAYRTEVACTADLDGDGSVAFSDILAVLAAWGDCKGCPEDLDGDGSVAFSDILIVLAAWGDC